MRVRTDRMNSDLLALNVKLNISPTIAFLPATVVAFVVYFVIATFCRDGGSSERASTSSQQP